MTKRLHLIGVAIALCLVACTGGSGGDRGSFDVAVSTGRVHVVTGPTSTPTTSTSAPLPSTTSPPPATSTTVVAASVVTPLVIADAQPDGYDRDLFGAGWSDADHDCQDTRAEVLIVESRSPITFTSATSCTVAGGDWTDPWSGVENTIARALDVDHTVPLANTWRSGAWAWSPEQRHAYANDLIDADHLIAIPLGENRSKGDDGPEGWKPPDQGSWCRYAQMWTAIKARWQLSATPAEWSALTVMAQTCP